MIELQKTSYLDHTIRTEPLHGDAFTDEQGAHKFIITCYQHGEKVNLIGTISGRFMRPGGSVALTGSVSDGQAIITLSSECYERNGGFLLTVFNTVGNDKFVIYACSGNVRRSKSDPLIDGGEIIDSVEDLISDIQTATAQIPVNYNASFAPAYSTTSTYAVGSYVTNNGNLYRCTTAITSGETWNSAHWTQVALGNDVADLRSAVTNVNAVYPFEYSGIINPGYAQNAGTWTGTTGSTRHTVMPIKPGSKIHVVAGSSTAAEFAILTQYAKPSNGDTVYFSASTGWTQVISVAKNTETEVLTAPNDAVWLYFNLGITPNFSRTPIKLEINGYDYISSIISNIHGIIYDISNINDNIDTKAPISSPAFTGNPTAPTQAANDNSTKIATTEYADRSTENGINTASLNSGLYLVTDPQFVHAGYLNSTPVWKSVTSGTIRCAIIPVTPGAFVSVTANNDQNFEIAAFKSYSDPVLDQSPDMSTATGWTNVISIKKGTNAIFVLPSDANYLYCYIGLSPTYTRLPVKLCINGYDYVSNAAANVSKNDLSRFRIMQYNLGHFNMGQPVATGRTVYYITSENYATILNNYKSLFTDYSPHIVGFDEYESQIFVKDANADTGTSHDMNTELFDLFFPYSDESSTSMASRRATKSIIPFIDDGRVQVEVSYEYNGQTYSYTFIVVYCHYNIGGHTVATVTTPYPSTNSSYSTEQNNEMKKAAFAAVVELCKNDENVILISDTNASPELQETIMEEILDPAGYNAVVGSGLRAVRWPITWESYTKNTKLSIDNIFYKGNMIAINYEVLYRLRNSLASDHAAMYADFAFLPKKL